MRLEWIEDILAVLDTGSLARAAEKRLLTQSAFTRRVRRHVSFDAVIHHPVFAPVRIDPDRRNIGIVFVAGPCRPGRPCTNQRPA